jgi:DNA-binding LacI/PurR family transcriptional regulator
VCPRAKAARAPRDGSSDLAEPLVGLPLLSGGDVLRRQRALHHVRQVHVLSRQFFEIFAVPFKSLLAGLQCQLSFWADTFSKSRCDTERQGGSVPRKPSQPGVLSEQIAPAQAGPRASTLTSIAAEAGVSVSTVSKVLNGRTDVAPATRERVGLLLRRRGYHPGSRLGFGVVDLLLGFGKHLPRGTAHSPWAEQLIHGTVQAAAEAGHSVVVTPVGSAGEFDRWLELAIVRGTHGALSLVHLPRGAELRQLAAAGIPVVVIDPAEEPGPGVRSVGATNWQGGLTATRHLIGLGHRRIAAISGVPRLWAGRARLDGYRAAMLEAGLAVDERLVCHDDWTVDGGRRQATRLLALPERPSAIVTANDEQSFGVLQALRDAGLRAPQDLSLVGFDDVPVAAWAAPPLTTIRQPLAAMADTAFRMLRSSGSAAGAEAHHVELATSLVVRDSTAPPRT